MALSQNSEFTPSLLPAEIDYNMKFTMSTQFQYLDEEECIMLKPPCERRCEDRRAGCHASCEKYHEYATIVGDARDRRIKFKQTEELLYGSHRRRR